MVIHASLYQGLVHSRNEDGGACWEAATGLRIKLSRCQAQL